ncbi:MAG: mechanosensitive ion channel [Deltaproteobacteria bacterium]|nr:mechanosensitive ion channel [Deltaproteobacteria bacterium]MDQ3296128.1 mechanosensitive ion channel [Myxococcota bacterium]
MSDTFAHATNLANIYLLPLGLRIVIAILVFFVGRALARALVRAFDRTMESSRLDVSLRRFLHDLVYALMLIAVVIAALDAVGIETTAVIAVLGAAGLAIGLALQGSLSNFAAGVMLITLRPYKVTDLVVLGKYVGRVEAIKVFHTILITADHREITIPNGQIISGAVENLTVLGRRRVDLIVTVNEAPDVARIKQLLEIAVLADERVFAAPPPSVEVSRVTETSVRLFLRPWTAVEHYEDVAASTMERLRDTMASAGLKFSVALQIT